jgi:thiol-disulfide isomerase/thioredoxin
VLAVGGVVGALLQARNGRIRAARSSAPTLPGRVSAALAPEGVTLVQISTTFCAPCRHTRVILSALADKTDGLTHVDLDVTETPEIAKALSVLRTPTTLALTPDGTEVFRVGGVPRGQELLEVLKPHLANA